MISKSNHCVILGKGKEGGDYWIRETKQVYYKCQMFHLYQQILDVTDLKRD